jgi:hypothetical protein
MSEGWAPSPSRAWNLLSSGWRPAAFIGALLLLPLIYASPEAPNRFHLGLPRVYSGDEPHYLVSINSVVLDGDLDVANNYAAVHRGASQAGQRFAGSALDHHTVWFEGATRRDWNKVFEDQPDRWDSDGEHHPTPRLRLGQPAPQPGHLEVSTHPPGLAILLGLLLRPLSGTDLIEPTAILCSALATILAMLSLLALARIYTSRPAAAALATALAFLATPAWHYARSLFTEPYLLLFTTASYSLTLRGRSPLLAGGMIGLGMMMKPTFILLGLPLFVLYSVERNFRAAATFALPVAVAVAATLWLDALLLGSPWRAVQEWQQGSLINGAWNIFFSFHKGLLLTAPAVVVAMLAWPRFLRAHRRDGVVLLAGVGLNFLLFASYGSWHGGLCYSVRYMVPVLPLFFISLVCLFELDWWRSYAFRGMVAALCALSFLTNARAAVQYWKSWETNLIHSALARN